MGMISILAATVAQAAISDVVPIKAVGVSPNGWISVAGIVISSVFGSGVLYGIFKGLALLIEQRNNRAKNDDDAAAVVRREMMEFNEKLQKRIDGLEQAGREDRKRFDEEMAAVRMQHATEVIQVRNGYEAEIRALRDEITGLRRQMVQLQQTSGAAIALGVKASTTTMRRVEESGLGDVLRGAYDVPGTGDADQG